MITSKTQCAGGCIAHTLQMQLEQVKHQLEVAQLDINSRFMLNVQDERRRRNLTPTVERRK